MQSGNNIGIIACAGSRKTSFIVERATLRPDLNTLITTYTNENIDQINAYIIQKLGYIPSNITVQPWFSFLLQDGVRPYQNYMVDTGRIQNLYFDSLPEFARRIPKTNRKRYYLTSSGQIYRDRMSEFVCECDDLSGGLVINRLQNIYSHIFFDEGQDFAGYDFDLLEKILRSNIRSCIVCDPRQSTFSTNNSRKNFKYKKQGICDWINKAHNLGIIDIEHKNECFRSNQYICDFADCLYPNSEKTRSKNTITTGHDGVFAIPETSIRQYHSHFNPTVLRYSIKSNTFGLDARNIGMSKGRTFDRVLVFATEPMKKYLLTHNLNDGGDLSKLYVAVTRARHSATFVVDENTFNKIYSAPSIKPTYWKTLSV